MSIEPFDYSTVMTATQAIFGTQVDIGQGISAMLTTRVSQDGKFTVVERRKVANIMKEQDFGASNRVKKSTAARIGQIRGADFTLMGDIVVFGRDDRRLAAGAGVGVNGTGGSAGLSKATGKAVVVLAYRLVDNESSEVIASGEARGESQRSSKGGMGGFFTGGVLVGGGISSTASNFGETIIGEAVMNAVSKLSADLSARGASAAASAKEVEIEANVADISGTNITINAGAGAGITNGMKLTVFRKGKEIKDPTTGEVLDVQTERIGDLLITSVRDRVATGTYTGAPAKIGDIVRN
ncbi:MAG: CsgG/HfaB family protein [Bryobacteraceae bacterium]|nr:CsgG/HfaB family protein [Bryobacteraceae bacterium]